MYHHGTGRQHAQPWVELVDLLQILFHRYYIIRGATRNPWTFLQNKEKSGESDDTSESTGAGLSGITALGCGGGSSTSLGSSGLACTRDRAARAGTGSAAARAAAACGSGSAVASIGELVAEAGESAGNCRGVLEETISSELDKLWDETYHYRRRSQRWRPTERKWQRSYRGRRAK